MPERWERELSKLRHIEAHEPVVRERVARGPSPTRTPPPRERVIAGIVAGAVAVAGLAFLWGALPTGEEPLGGDPRDLPVLSITFQTNGAIEGNPEPYTRRIDTRIAYGAALDESFTTTTPPNAVVDMVNAEEVTSFLPGPTVGSPIAFEADGDAPRVSIGTLEQWPDFEKFTEIQQLPEEPGEYILVFEADYPEGVGRTSRRVRVVEPGVLQLVLRETGDEQALSGDAYVDGRGAAGFLSETSFTEGDTGPLEKAPEAPTFSPEAWLDIEPGSPVMLVTSATTATSGTFDSYDTFVPGADLPNDLLAGPATIEGSGRVLLAVEATWVHPAPGSGESATSERALFFFPIEVEDPDTADQEPTPEASPSSPSTLAERSPSPTTPGEVDGTAAPALRVRCDADGAEILTQVVAAQPDGLHVEPIDVPDGWSIGLRSSGDEMATMFSGSDGADGPFIRPLAPGQGSVVCVPPAPTFAEDEIERLFREDAAIFELVDQANHFTSYELSCGVEEHVRLYHTVAGSTEEEAAQALHDVAGVGATDQVDRAGYPQGALVPWGWRLVREGSVLAVFQVDEFRGYVVDGLVCASSGIDPGTPP